MSHYFSHHKTRHNVYNILQNNSFDSKTNRWVDWFLIALIVANVIAVVIESVDAWYYPNEMLFKWFEYFSLFVFSVEYLLRMWSVVEERPDISGIKQRLLWIKSPGAIIDLLAILPGLLSFFIAIDLRFLRILRLFRLLKLTRYFPSIKVIFVVLEKEKSAFQAVVFILSILIITAASGIYLLENQAQPEEFESIPQSMWWAVVTLTTVGYGDVVPITTAGKILGAIITISGVGITALPAGILASGLAREFKNRRAELRQTFKEMLLEEEADLLHNQFRMDEMRKELGLSEPVAKDIYIEVVREQSLIKREKELHRKNFCPHCGERLD